MNRLPSELHRLYLPQPTEGSADQLAESADTALVDASGKVRAMVLGLAGPADWGALAKVWSGVQADLELPAPAIAVAGGQGYQLWFSLAQAIPASGAAAFLEALRRRYLGDVAMRRISLLPALDAESPQPIRHARLVPAALPGGDRWSAFVAPDLAPMFAEEPWLDMPPNPDGQAELLARLASIAPADFQGALERLVPAPAPAAGGRPSGMGSRAADHEPGGGESGAAPMTGRWEDPGDFLLEVMNNGSVALALRIEAAKALLPYRREPTRP